MPVVPKSFSYAKKYPPLVEYAHHAEVCIRGELQPHDRP